MPDTIGRARHRVPRPHYRSPNRRPGAHSTSISSRRGCECESNGACWSTATRPLEWRRRSTGKSVGLDMASRCVESHRRRMVCTTGLLVARAVTFATSVLDHSGMRMVLQPAATETLVATPARPTPLPRLPQHRHPALRALPSHLRRPRIDATPPRPPQGRVAGQDWTICLDPVQVTEPAPRQVRRHGLFAYRPAKPNKWGTISYELWAGDSGD